MTRVKIKTINLMFCFFIIGTLTSWAVDIQPPNNRKRPNILFILADDLGMETIRAGGGESYPTPNLDRLAKQGMMFVNAFANPLCTPSRVELMTGLYNVRNYTGFGKMERSETSFGNLLQKAGYATGIAGKWQLGKEPDSPQHFGFEDALLWQHELPRTRKGTHHDSRYPNPVLEHNGVATYYKNGEYGPSLCTDFICHFIEKNKDRPFFAYFPMILVHCPFDATPDTQEWDPKSMGAVSYKGNPKYFGDMVAYMDKNVGQVLQTLDRLGLTDNTLVIFTGDNGTDHPIVSQWRGMKVPGGKGEMNDNGTRTSFFVSWPGRIKPGGVSDELVDFTDVLPTICDAAGVSQPSGYPGDGQSLMPTLLGAPGRQKPWVYVWFAGKVFARTKDYMVRGPWDGSHYELFHFSGPYQEEKVPTESMTPAAKQIKHDLQQVITRMAATRTIHDTPKFSENEK